MNFSRLNACLAASAASAVLLTAGSLHAQQPSETELQQVVVESANGTDAGKGTGTVKGIVAKKSKSASKTATPLIETPQAVNVVTRDQMDAQGANSVAEALRYTPGLQADPNGADIRYDWLYVRGFNLYSTNWLDGLTLPGDPSNYATPSVNSYALDRVEVIKGPASVLYGRSLPGGLVNLVSKRPQEETHREVSLQTSAFGGIQGAVDMTGKLTEDGQFLYRFIGLGKNLDTQIDHEVDRQIMLAPSISWVPTDDTTFTVYGYYQHDNPVFSPRFYPARGTLLPNPYGQIPRDVFLGDPDWGSSVRDFYALGYEFEHRFDETWTVRQNLRYAAADQHMDLVLVNPAFAYPFPGTPTGSRLDRVTAISDDELTAFTVDTQAEAHFDTGDLSHTLLMGIDYVRATSGTEFGNTGPGTYVPPIDYLNPSYGFDYPTAPVTRSGLQHQQQVGVYAQDQVRYGNWIGTFGLRYDRSEIDSLNRLTDTTVNTDDGKLTGRAGITYLFDNGLAPYVSYSTAFLPLLGSDRLGNPFVAQTAEQFEVGVKYEPVQGRGMIGVSLFSMDIANALTPDPADSKFSVQTGKQRVQGFEIEGKYELIPSIDILASYAYTHSEVLESNNKAELGREMLRLPEHQGSLWVTYRPDFVPGLSLGAGVRAQSSYQTDSTYKPELRIPARALVDIGAEYDFGALDKDMEGTKLRVNVTNLFDEKYVSHCLNLTGGSCNYGAGRAITANLKYTW
ncbi:TonB-dependent siderophore receptor [Mesorhizobium sp. 8]|nr:TonB-dependent siderophore receptor [Mesorhizobium sp. 8]